MFCFVVVSFLFLSFICFVGVCVCYDALWLAQISSIAIWGTPAPELWGIEASCREALVQNSVLERLNQSFMACKNV